VRFAIEPLAPSEGCDFVVNTHEAAEVVREINSPHFRLHLDTKTMMLNNEDMESVLRDNLDIVSHIHFSVKDLGEIAPFAPTLSRWAKIISRSAYDGWVSLEMRRVEQGNAEHVRRNVSQLMSFF
jgi:sugar phosphate isomerase/epimerase